MKNTIPISLNYSVSDRGFTSKAVRVPRGMTFNGLARAVKSEPGICEFDPVTESATRGWSRERSLELRAGMMYHVDPPQEIQEAIAEMPNGSYLNRATFQRV